MAARAPVSASSVHGANATQLPSAWFGRGRPASAASVASAEAEGDRALPDRTWLRRRFEGRQRKGRSPLGAGWALLRAGNGAMTGIGVFVGGWIQGGTGPFHSWPIYAAGLAAFCVAAFGNLLNDLGDIEVDRRAHPDRPLPRQEISVSVARLMAVGCAIVGIGLAALVSVPVALFAAAAFLLLVLYEIRLKALGLPGNAAVSLLTGAPFVFGGLVLGTPGSGLLLLAGLAALSNLGREVLKDIEDMGGDVGRATFPRTRGVPAARAVAASSFGAAVLLSPLPWVDSIVGSGYVPFVLLADAGFVAAALDPKAGRGQRVAKAAMVVALVAFIAGRSFGGAVHGA